MANEEGRIEPEDMKEEANSKHDSGNGNGAECDGQCDCETVCKVCGEDVPVIAWPDPQPEELDLPEFNAVWNAIKSWDINVPVVYIGYCGATGNHVRKILDALRAINPNFCPPKQMRDS